MTIVPFHQVGKQGIIKDIPGHELPPGPWSDGKNIIFRDGKIIRRGGQAQVFGAISTSFPHWMMFAFTPINAFWMYSSLTQMFATDGATHVNITRASGDYNTQPESLWNGGILTGIPIITNNVDVPQVWTPVSLSQDLVDLPNWPATDRARVMKPFKNFMVAMNITRSSVNFPHMVKWSHPAEPGAVPSSWDHTDPTVLTGEVEIGEELPGVIEDALALRDMMVIYKTNSVWGMQFIGGQSLFRFYNILNFSGLLSTHCVASVLDGKAHVLASTDDFILFDGQNTKSLLDSRWKKYIEDNLEEENSNLAFVFSVPQTKEAWFCFPTLTNKWPNVALIWNWREDTITLRDLPSTFTYATIGALSAEGDAWDDDLETWDSDTEFWDVVRFRPNFFGIIGATLTPNRLIQLDIGQTFTGTQYTSFVQRVGLAVTGQDRVTGQIKSDPTVRKLVTRIWLKARGSPFQVRMGIQETVDDGITWTAEQTFTPGGDQKYLDFSMNTPLIAVEFSSDVAGEWTIEGYDLELVTLGNL